MIQNLRSMFNLYKAPYIFSYTGSIITHTTHSTCFKFMDTDVDSNTAVNIDSRTDSIHTNLDSHTFGSTDVHTHTHGHWHWLQYSHTPRQQVWQHSHKSRLTNFWQHWYTNTRMDTDVDSNTATYIDSKTDSIHTNLDSKTFGSIKMHTLLTVHTSNARKQTLTSKQLYTIYQDPPGQTNTGSKTKAEHFECCLLVA